VPRSLEFGPPAARQTSVTLAPGHTWRDMASLRCCCLRCSEGHQELGALPWSPLLCKHTCDADDGQALAVGARNGINHAQAANLFAYRSEAIIVVSHAPHCLN